MLESFANGHNLRILVTLEVLEGMQSTAGEE